MTNQYYVPDSGNVARPGQTVRSAQFNDNNETIEQGFDLLPAPMDLFSNRQNFGIATSDVANVYEVEVSPTVLTSFQDGMQVEVRFPSANTGPAQLNLNSLGVKQIRTIQGQPVRDGDIVANASGGLRFDLANDWWQLDTALSTTQNFANQAAASAAAAATSEGNAAQSEANVDQDAMSAAQDAARAEAAAQVAQAGSVPILQPRQLGDGVTRVFNSPQTVVVDPEGLFVHENGEKSRPTTDYLSPNVGQIEFATAPALGVEIDIIWFAPVVLPTPDLPIISTGSTTARPLSERFAEVVNVKDFGAIGDGVADDTLSIQGALSYARDTNRLVLFPSGNRFLYTATLDFSRCNIQSDNAVLLKSFDGLGVLIAGDTIYTNVYGHLRLEGHGDGYSDGLSASTSPNAHGVQIQGRCRIEGTLFSRNHQGNGFQITTDIGNMNKCVFDSLWTLYCSGYGIRFSGTRDDASVWKLRTYTQFNYAGGVFIDDNYLGRQWEWFCYNEGTTDPLAPYGVYLGGLAGAYIFLYSEEQTATSADAIHQPDIAGRGYNEIRDARSTRTVNLSPSTQVFRGRVPYYYGSNGSTVDFDVFINTTNNVNNTRVKELHRAGREIIAKEIITGSGGWKMQPQNTAANVVASVGALSNTGLVQGWKSNGRADLFFESYRGTPDSPLPLQSGNLMSRLSGRAATSASTIAEGYAIKGQVVGTPTSSSLTTNLLFDVNNGSTSATTRMTLQSNGVLNVPAGVTPFTGLHLGRSKTKLSVGFAVDVVKIIREDLDILSEEYNDEGKLIKVHVIDTIVRCTPLLTHSKDPMSKVCAGIVEDCQAREDGLYDIIVAAVGDNSTNNLVGFLVCNEGGEISPGDILCTSSKEGYLMKCNSGVSEEVVKFKALEAPQDGVCYGYFK